METSNTPNVVNVIIEFILKIWPILLGGGGLVGVFSAFSRWRSNNRQFDIKMDRIKVQNRQLSNTLISYVPRKTLDRAIEVFLNSSYIVCAILGPAGSGKTRFAQNITRRNTIFSKYHYIYINEKSGTFFSSDDFKNNYNINGSRKYVFIFDYVFENITAINNLLDKAIQSGRHKFIFVERDYGWTSHRLLDRPEYKIIMEEHNMNKKMLSEVFCNQVRLLNKKCTQNALKEKSNQYAEAIITKIDPVYSRPIFAQLIAEIFVKNPSFELSNIDNVSKIVEKYWHYKFDEKKISLIIHTYIPNVDSRFIENLEILLRIILLTASITKERILVIKRDNVLFQIENSKSVDNVKFNQIITESCEKSFIEKLNLLDEKTVRQLFGIILKDYLKQNTRNSIGIIEVIAELDLISEWVLSDSLKRNELWINIITSFFNNSYRDNYVAFIKRGTIDFIDLVQLFVCDNGINDFIELLTQRIDEAYLSNTQFAYEIIRNIVDNARKLFVKDNYNSIIYKALINVRKCYLETHNKELTEQLYEIMEV